MRSIDGGCHCGTIRYRLTWPDDRAEIPVRACSCSFCTKHRGVYTSHPDAGLDVVIVDGSLVSTYRFGTGTADFFVCRRCGVVPFVTSLIDDRLFAVVNVNTFEANEPLALIETRTDFADESIGSRLERRKTTWIAEVSIERRSG